MDDFFGLLGLVLILFAWIPGTIETIKSKKPGMKRRFMALYFLGSSSLSYYAFELNSIPFLALNALAAIVPLIHLHFYIKRHGISKLFTPTKDRNL